MARWDNETILDEWEELKLPNYGELPKGRKEPEWMQAERYFRQTRDTLPEPPRRMKLK